MNGSPGFGRGAFLDLSIYVLRSTKAFRKCGISYSWKKMMPDASGKLLLVALDDDITPLIEYLKDNRENFGLSKKDIRKITKAYRDSLLDSSTFIQVVDKKKSFWRSLFGLD